MRRSSESNRYTNQNGIRVEVSSNNLKTRTKLMALIELSITIEIETITKIETKIEIKAYTETNIDTTSKRNV